MATAAATPATTTRDRRTRSGQPAADPGADVATDHRAGGEQHDGVPVAGRREDEDQPGHHVADHQRQRPQPGDDLERQVGAEAEHGDHHHAGAGAEVAAVHPGQRGEEGRHGGEVVARLRRCRRAAAAGQPAGDLGCAPTSRQVNRISHGTTASKTPGGSAEQHDRADAGAHDAAGQDHPAHPWVLPQLRAVAVRPAEPAGHQAEGVGHVGRHGRQPEGDQGGEADDRGDADGGGHDPGDQSRPEHQRAARVPVRGARGAAPRRLTITTCSCMAAAAPAGLQLRDDRLRDPQCVAPSDANGRPASRERLVQAGLDDQLADGPHHGGGSSGE